MLGSVPTAPSWHGLWLRLIEDITLARAMARGALPLASGSALATRSRTSGPEAGTILVP